MILYVGKMNNAIIWGGTLLGSLLKIAGLLSYNLGVGLERSLRLREKQYCEAAQRHCEGCDEEGTVLAQMNFICVRMLYTNCLAKL